MRARLDPLVASGVALAALTLVGYTWAGLSFDADSGDGPTASVVRLGGAGLLAAGLGWASVAARPGQAFGRAAGLDVLGIVVLLAAAWMGEAIDGDGASFSSQALGAGDTDSATLLLLYLGLTSVIVGLLGLLARASATVGGAPGKARALGALTVALVLAVGALDLADGAEVAMVIAIVSAGWLAVVLRRARAVQRARLQRREDDLDSGRLVLLAAGDAPGGLVPYRVPTALAVVGGILAVVALAGPLLVAEHVPILGAAGLWAVIAVLAAMRFTPVGAIAVGGLGFLVVGRVLGSVVGAAEGPSVIEWDGLLAWSDAGTPPWGWWSWGGLGALAGIAGRYVVVATSRPGRAFATVLLLVPFSLEALHWIAAEWHLGAVVAVAAGLWLRLTLEWVRLDRIRGIVAAEHARSEAGAGDRGAATEATARPE